MFRSAEMSGIICRSLRLAFRINLSLADGAFCLPRHPAQSDARGGDDSAGEADDEAASEALRALCNLCHTFSQSQGFAPGQRRHEKADWAVAAGVVPHLISIADTRPRLADLVRTRSIQARRRGLNCAGKKASFLALPDSEKQRTTDAPNTAPCAAPPERPGSGIPLLAPVRVRGHPPQACGGAGRPSVPQPPEQPQLAGAKNGAQRNSVICLQSESRVAMREARPRHETLPEISPLRRIARLACDRRPVGACGRGPGCLAVHGPEEDRAGPPRRGCGTTPSVALSPAPRPLSLFCAGAGFSFIPLSLSHSLTHLFVQHL